MLIVETIAKIRRYYHVEKKGFKTIAKEFNLSKNTVKKIIRGNRTSQTYKRNNQNYRVLDNFISQLTSALEADKKEPKRRRRTSKKLYHELCSDGFKGSYTTVNAFVQKWKRENKQGTRQVFIPLEFDTGEAFQFDWSEEEIMLQEKVIKVKAAHIRLCHSRLFLVVVYRNEQIEMVMDAHDKAFQFFGGVPRKGIYDNMKTAVQKILIGKNREFNKRFAEMASHYLFEPIACTPAAGWEKGQVENQVSTGRRNFFTPLRRVESIEELNEQLRQECLNWAQKTTHPEFKDRIVWDVFQEESQHLIEYRHSFDSYKIKASVISSCSLIHYETNMYSVYCDYVGEAAEIRIYVDKIIAINNGKIIGEHKRCFDRYKRIYNPLHYLSALERKPGALRNGAPFKHWNLPNALSKVQKNLARYSDGDKQFIDILLQILTYGLDKVEDACLKAANDGSCCADIVIYYLNKNNADLENQPNDDCSCYNNILICPPTAELMEVAYVA